MTRRSVLVYGLIAAVWLLFGGWQVEEHYRFKNAAKTDLRNRSKDIANTLSAFIRGLRFRGVVVLDRLDPVLSEVVNGRTNELVKSSQVLSIALLNAAGETITSAGRPLDLAQKELLQEGERWGVHSVTLINPVDLGVSMASQGVTNPTIVLPPFREMTNSSRDPGRTFSRRDNRDGRPEDRPPVMVTNASGEVEPAPPPPDHEPRRHDGPGEGSPRSRPPFWLRNMNSDEFQEMIQKRALHGLVLTMSTETFIAACERDLWMRIVIMSLASVLALGSGLAWHNVSRLSDLQIRLVRASELNTHLKEMNLAAAGLAHETRNPLNIIRGLAQMISRQPDASGELRKKTRDILDETDKVTAQLNEFINYSRPREVRRSPLALNSVIAEVVRALTFDIEEKKIEIKISGAPLTILADEQLLRQTLFNLLLNAIQVANPTGWIEVVTEQRGSEAQLEVRDNGPGVPAERRSEIFKPYFTTQKTGTGLGLAVVQQIVLAHGWEIECVPNEPAGAIFRITHIKLAA